MARDRANIRTDMISDDDYRDLTHSEQWLYKLLLIHPSLSYAGVADWRPGKLASTSGDLNADQIRRIGAGLQAKHFIHVDEDTEEVFVRSFVKHDGLLKQYRLPVSMANDYAAISSKEIRQYFIHELKRVHEKFPDLKCWEIDRVSALLERPAMDMKANTYPNGSGDTQADGSANTCSNSYGIGYGNGYAETPGKGYGLRTATTTSTATTSVPYGTEVTAGANENHTPNGVHPLPKNWKPDPAALEVIRKKRHNVNKIVSTFVEKAEGAMVRDWDVKFADHVRTLKPEPATVWNT